MLNDFMERVNTYGKKRFIIYNLYFFTLLVLGATGQLSGKTFNIAMATIAIVTFYRFIALGEIKKLSKEKAILCDMIYLSSLIVLIVLSLVNLNELIGEFWRVNK